MLCLVVVTGQLLLVAGIPAGPPLMVAGLLVATVAQLAAVSLMHAAVIAAAPGAVGRAAGVTMAGYYLGALAGPPLFGLLVDRTGGYGPAWLACAARRAAPDDADRPRDIERVPDDGVSGGGGARGGVGAL